MKSALHIGNLAGASGRNRSLVEDLAGRMKSGGWNVFLASAVESRPLRLLDMISTIWRQRRHFKVGHISVYSGSAFFWAEASALAMRAADRPFILSLHGGNLPAFAGRWPGRVRRLLHSADAVLAPSRYLIEQLRPYRDDMHFIPNPIELPRYEFLRRSAARPSLVWLRAFHRTYNPSLAPLVVAKLAVEFPEIHLLMVGPDKKDGSREHTIKTAESLGVSARVGMPGLVARDDVGHWMNKGDIFLNTTNVDNTPVSVLEAMACGLCIVSTDVGGIPYLLEDGKDALLVPANDPRAMAAAVRRILTDPGLAKRLSINARKKVEAFDWEQILPQWDALLTSVIQGSSN